MSDIQIIKSAEAQGPDKNEFIENVFICSELHMIRDLKSNQITQLVNKEELRMASS